VSSTVSEGMHEILFSQHMHIHTHTYNITDTHPPTPTHTRTRNYLLLCDISSVFVAQISTQPVSGRCVRGVCTYVMCACVYVCLLCIKMYAYFLVHAYMYVRVCVRAFVFIVSVNACKHNVCMCVYLCSYVCVSVRVCMCVSCMCVMSV